MSTKIQLKRGLEKDLPLLAVGEPAFTTDSGKLFIGSPSGNIQILSNGGISGLTSPNAQSWISTNNQDTFTITTGSISNAKSLIVFVDGIIQPDTILLNSTSFKLAEPISAGIDVYAMWFEISSTIGQQTPAVTNSCSWVSTNAQDTFQISNGSISDIKLLNVYVGGVLQPNITLLDNKTFKLPETLSAGVNVYAEWFEVAIPVTIGHHITHESGGQDEIDITKLKNYSTLIQTPLNVLIGLNDYSTQYTYNVSGDIATEVVTDSTGNTISSTTYNYLNNQVSTIIFTMNGTTVTSTYNYDGNGNLTSVVNTKS